MQTILHDFQLKVLTDKAYQCSNHDLAYPQIISIHVYLAFAENDGLVNSARVNHINKGSILFSLTLKLSFQITECAAIHGF